MGKIYLWLYLVVATNNNRKQVAAYYTMTNQKYTFLIHFSESYRNFALRQKCFSLWIWWSWQRSCICAQIIRVHSICVRSRSNMCPSGIVKWLISRNFQLKNISWKLHNVVKAEIYSHKVKVYCGKVLQKNAITQKNFVKSTL